LTASKEAIIEYFQLKKGFCIKPRYNIAPAQLIPIIRTPGEIEFLHWGFKPAWMKAETVGNGFINARAETITEKPSFSDALKKRRCLILTDGYYEWKLVGRTKQPYYICRKDRKVFALAGIWEKETCAIITISANAIISPIHERMPVLLSQEAHSLWLDSTCKQNERIASLLMPFPSESLEVYPVSPKVNNVLFDTLDCIRSLHA
jgi:putative SOS response-associated peptidase YedK